MIQTNNTTNNITSSDLPAVLVGGPPDAGKSVLTYNLTQALRERQVPHYVLRANPDGEGDWFMKGDPDTVRQIRADAKSKWSKEFRELVSRDLAKRHLPLIVDLGGYPNPADAAIFAGCTHSILLLRDDKPDDTVTWHSYTRSLTPVAELRSQWEGEAVPPTSENPLKGTLVHLRRPAKAEPYTPLQSTVFKKLVKLVEKLFDYQESSLIQLHLGQSPVETVVNLPKLLKALAPDRGEDGQWTPDLLQPLLSKLPSHAALAIYGRAPVWVYSAVAMHEGSQPFRQFDARLSWVKPPSVKIGSVEKQRDITISKEVQGNAFILRIKPIFGYLDITEANEILFPEPPPQHGVILSGKLPQWLFTSLARLYAQRHVPWIAVNDAHNNSPVVIYSHDTKYPIGKILPTLE